MNHHVETTPGLIPKHSIEPQPGTVAEPERQPQVEALHQVVGKLLSGNPSQDAWLAATLADLCFDHLRRTSRRWICVVGAPRTAGRRRAEDRLREGQSAAHGLAVVLRPYAPAAQHQPTRPHPSHYGETTRAQVALWHLEQIDHLRGLAAPTAADLAAIDLHLSVVEALEAEELEDIDAGEVLL
jgi:hypothetical protein